MQVRPRLFLSLRRRIAMEGSHVASKVGKPIRLIHSAHTSRPELVLPRLPVPKLDDTVSKYLKSLEPFIYDNATLHGGPTFEDARQQYEQLAQNFIVNEGQAAQSELLGKCHCDFGNCRT
jgi:hypothetical protein